MIRVGTSVSNLDKDWVGPTLAGGVGIPSI